MIKIQANGKSFEVTEDTPLPSFVESLGLAMPRVVVEFNGEAKTPQEAAQVVLQDGDRLEIVKIVAGG